MRTIELHPISLVLGGVCGIVGLALVGMSQAASAGSPRSLPGGFMLTAEEKEILSHMSVAFVDDGFGGQLKTIRISGANVQIVNGGGSTDSVDGLGNLILGYNEFGAYGFSEERTGSHNIIAGRMNTYSSFGGVVFGENNRITAPWATVTGGFRNEATGEGAAVASGSENKATARWSAASGGQRNQATQEGAWVGGGQWNTADGTFACVVGGGSNYAGGSHASVHGGGNVGGPGAAAMGSFSTAVGGRNNTASGTASTVVGGESNVAAGGYSSVSGGQSRSASGSHDWVAGSLLEEN